MIVDLHCHSNCSDGELAVEGLLALAVEKKVEVLSITDHDTLRAYDNRDTFAAHPVKIIPGIELSTQWQKIGIHILGLNVQLQSGAMQRAESEQRRARQERAGKIASRLERAGLKNAFDGAKRQAGNAEIARPHFAQFMVESGFCRSVEQAFSKYLGAGKAGDIKQCWASMEQVVSWIRDGGGIAVLAHPCKYQLTRSKLTSLLDDFQLAGGSGIEVLSGQQGKDVTEMLSALAVQKRLLVSMGSDFHGATTPWNKLGMHTALPKACAPVWDMF